MLAGLFQRLFKRNHTVGSCTFNANGIKQKGETIMTMPMNTKALDKLPNEAPLKHISAQSMDLRIKASTPASTQLAIKFISNLSGVKCVHAGPTNPATFKAMIRIEYCPQKTFAEQIKQEVARQGLITRQHRCLSARNV